MLTTRPARTPWRAGLRPGPGGGGHQRRDPRIAYDRWMTSSGLSDESGDGGEDLWTAHLSGPEPQLLVDLTSMHQDMTEAASLFKIMAAELETLDPLIARCMYCTAVISYRRCFTTGRRQRIPRGTVEEMLNDRELAVHREILSSADQHVAHRVNVEQQSAAVVLLRDPAVGREVLGAGVILLEEVAKEPEWYDLASEVAAYIEWNLGRDRDQLQLRIAEDMKTLELGSLYGVAKKEAFAIETTPSPLSPPENT